MERLRQSQNPKTMLIGCSDSRVDPAIITQAGPGDIFTVRNVANLVPPCELTQGYHGVSAALEFGVCQLGVEHIVVLGHSQCGGIQALMTAPCLASGNSFVSRWMSIAVPAREKVLLELPAKSFELKCKATEQASILMSLENLRSFPFIEERVNQQSLSLHGWYFDLRRQELSEYHPDCGRFVEV